MVTFYGFLDLFRFDIATVRPLVFRIFHEIASLQPDPGIDGRKNPDHSAPDLPPLTVPLLASHVGLLGVNSKNKNRDVYIRYASCL